MEFPLLEAYLLCPNKENGKIGICTNQIAPGTVLNEIPERLRKNICAIGPLIVNRGGTERMIVNSLVHEKLKYLILFGEESISFKPSTNLLLAIMNGYEKSKRGNYIKNFVGLGAQYPNISEKVLKLFREDIIVLPIFRHENSKEIVKNYLDWIKPRISKETYGCLKEINEKKKIYFNSLTNLIETLFKEPATEKKSVNINPEEFNHLQPKIINLEPIDKIEEVNFEVKQDGENIVVNVDFGENLYTIKGRESFLLAYSLMNFMNQNNLKLPIKHQLLLGAEISRAEMEIRHKISTKSLVKSNIKEGQRKEIPMQGQPILREDKEYYYSIFLRQGNICVQAITYKDCKYVFELRSKSVMSLIEKLAKENLFQDYEQQALHRMDVGIEIGRAGIALQENSIFIQDFHYLFKINKTKFPFFVVDGDSFLTNHKKIVTSLYTRGVSQEHPDSHKGPMRSGTVLCVFRNPKESLKKMPRIYTYENQSEKDIREKYKEQLLSPKEVGTYTYGNRTKAHFKVDQLEEAIKFLKEKPNLPFVIQRFDYVNDMVAREVSRYGEDGEIKSRVESTHDPCLTHDIYFISDNKLYCFHIARVQNIVNAYPENIFGLYDAYDKYVAEELDLELGDMFMLSSRANILLLTEEQRAKTIMREPSKPVTELDSSIGPYKIGDSFPNKGIGYCEIDLKEQEEKPEHPCLEVLENYERLNIIEKAINYLKLKGEGHNNPVIGTYNPKEEKLNEENRLIFFQANIRAGKVQATAVFLNGSKDKLEKDVELCNYLATQFSKKLNKPLGKLFFFYVPIKS